MQIKDLPTAESLQITDSFAIDNQSGITKKMTAEQLIAATRSLSYGAPLVAQTAAGMTDQTKVYVYTGGETGYAAGHWYYYNGSAWTDGGAYNSSAVQTDTTLAVSGAAGDSKAAGDAIKATRGMVAPIETTTTASRAYAVGAYFVYNGQLYEATAAIASGGTITTSGASANCKTAVISDSVTDLNSALTNNADSVIKLGQSLYNHVYRVPIVAEHGTLNSTGGKVDNNKYLRSNFEFGCISDKLIVTIPTGYRIFLVKIAEDGTTAQSTTITTSTTVDVDKTCKYRFYGRNNDTTVITDEALATFNTGFSLTFLNTNRIVYPTLITSNNYASVLPDFNNAEDNMTYVMTFIRSASSFPANMPSIGSLFSVDSRMFGTLDAYSDGVTRYQVFSAGNIIKSRYKLVNDSWSAWVNCGVPSTYVVNKSGGGDFASLAEAIETAITSPDSTVIVKAGTYDILAEYQALHPDDWSTRQDGRGIYLNNNIKLIFDSNAKVTCHYTGSDPSVLENFSAFNVRHGSASIINATIEASNVRYCVHDDMWTSSTPYHVLYRDCIMSIDNSQNPENSEYPHCIGGGFGKDAHIDIENCIFSGTGGDGTTYPAPSDNSIVSWHNGPNASQLSHLNMTGCYFNGTGTFRSLSNGTATEESTLVISNNSFGSAIVEGYSPGANTPNMRVIAFNNEVRN